MNSFIKYICIEGCGKVFQLIMHFKKIEKEENPVILILRKNNFNLIMYLKSAWTFTLMAICIAVNEANAIVLLYYLTRYTLFAS